MAQEKYIEIAVINTNKVLFSGKAKSFSSTNENGRFDILANHQPFISLIKDFIEIRAKEGQKFKIDIKTAVLYLKNNKLTVFVGIEDI